MTSFDPFDPSKYPSDRISDGKIKGNCICLTSEAIKPYGTNRITSKLALKNDEYYLWNMNLKTDVKVTIWTYSDWTDSHPTYPGFFYHTFKAGAKNNIYYLGFVDGTLIDYHKENKDKRTPIINFKLYGIDATDKTLYIAWQWQKPSKTTVDPIITNLMKRNEGNTDVPQSPFVTSCFFTEDGDKKPQCSKCTEDNILEGCLGIDIEDNPLEILPIAAAGVGALFLLRAFGFIG